MGMYTQQQKNSDDTNSELKKKWGNERKET